MVDTTYATIAELKADINKSDNTDNTALQRLLNAAAFCIDHWTNRPHKSATVIDTFVAPGTASARIFSSTLGYYIYTDECVEYTLVEQKDSPSDTTYESLAAADWQAFSGDPERPDFNSIPYHGIMISAVGSQEPFTSGAYSFRPGFRPSQTGRRGTPTLRITGKWGFSTVVPPVVKQATILQAARWFKRGQSAWADVLANADAGLLMYRQRIDPDLYMMLANARLIRPAL